MSRPVGMCEWGKHDFDVLADACRRCGYHGKVIKLHQGSGGLQCQPISYLDDGNVTRTLATFGQLSSSGQVRGYDGVRLETSDGQIVTFATTPPARPVRVGDMVFDSRNDKPRRVAQCNMLHPSGPWLVIGDGEPHDPLAWSDQVSACRHADGAPIDVTASLAIARGEPTEMPPGPPLSPEKRAACMQLVQREYDSLAAQIAQSHAAMNANIQQQQVNGREQMAAQARGNQFDMTAAAYQARDTKVTAELEAAQKRIAELEAKYEVARGDRRAAYERASRLSDMAGELRTSRDDLLRENAVLRRALESAERKAAKR